MAAPNWEAGATAHNPSPTYQSHKPTMEPTKAQACEDSQRERILESLLSRARSHVFDEDEESAAQAQRDIAKLKIALAPYWEARASERAYRASERLLARWN